MVEYEYPELFEEHESVHFIIVNSGATVTIVSGDAPTITDEDYLITENKLKQESFSLTESLCSLNNLKFGIGESAVVKFTVYNSDEIPNLKDEEITIYLYFNEDSDTLFKVGTYRITEDEYSPDRAFRNVLGYDILDYLWDYDITDWYNQYFTTNNTSTIGDLRNALFTWLGQQNESYTIHQRTVELVNDDVVIEKGIDSDVITFGFLMQPLLEVNGVFMHVDREGYITYIQVEWYDKAPVKVYDEHCVFPPFKYEDYETWGIGYVLVFDKDDKRIFKVGSTNQKHPSNYTIVDSFVFSNEQKRSGWKSDMKDMLTNMRQAITHLRYRPCEFKTIGNLCYEPGDRVNYIYITYDDNDEPITNNIRTYIWERTFSGIQGFKDLISAKGDKKQPKYKPKKDKWHSGDGADGETTNGYGGISLYDDNVAKWFVQVIRNIGLRLLDEPDNVSVVYNKQSGQVEIKWEDPIDITTFNPVPAEWAGTVVVRKEGSVPLHRYGGKWGGTLLTDSQVRDQYKNDAYVDNTVEVNKKYYYGIFPYSIALDDEDHPIRHYRFTKVISVDTTVYIMAPTIESLEVENVNVTVTYDIPEIDGLYSYCKLVVKKGGIPVDVEDGDVILTLNESLTEVEVTGLDAESRYYFVIFTADTDGNTANSDSPDAVIGIDEGWNYDYTGQEEVFEAPATGVYSLETWGAQGGNATDGENVARGGYGAYAYGEVFLTQGDTLYINVGGQNGYGGGGSILQDFNDIAETLDLSRNIMSTTTNGGADSEVNQEQWRPYYHQNYMLWCGSQYKRAIVWDSADSCYKFPDENVGSNNNPFTCWHFPIKRMMDVIKIELDVSIKNSSYTSKQPNLLALSFSKFVSSDTISSWGWDATPQPEAITIQNGRGSQSYTPDVQLSDSNWRHCEKVISGVDYADFITVWGIAGEIKFKNIKIQGILIG